MYLSIFQVFRHLFSCPFVHHNTASTRATMSHRKREKLGNYSPVEMEFSSIGSGQVLILPHATGKEISTPLHQAKNIAAESIFVDLNHRAKHFTFSSNTRQQRRDALPSSGRDVCRMSGMAKVWLGLWVVKCDGTKSFKTSTSCQTRAFRQTPRELKKKLFRCTLPAAASLSSSVASGPWETIAFTVGHGTITCHAIWGDVAPLNPLPKAAPPRFRCETKYQEVVRFLSKIVRELTHAFGHQTISPLFVSIKTLMNASLRLSKVSFVQNFHTIKHSKYSKTPLQEPGYLFFSPHPTLVGEAYGKARQG